MRRLGFVAFAGIVVAILAWQLLPSLLIRLPGLLAPDVGPPREVVWQAGPASPAAPPKERPPNIVVILADDLGWNDLSFRGGGLGGGQVKTPRIDSIAAAGVSFTSGYSANATCAPARAALLTGRYPTRAGYEFTPAGVPYMRGVAYFNRNETPPLTW